MRKWIFLVTGLICAVMMSQFPEYYQQYRQRLGGTLDELNFQIKSLDKRAFEEGYNRFDYIREVQNSQDALARREANALVDLLTRQYDVETAVQRLDRIHEHFQLPFMVLYLDEGTAKATLENYVPAIPLTRVSAIYAGGGFLTGFLGMFFLFLFIPRFSRKAKAEVSENDEDSSSEPSQPAKNAQRLNKKLKKKSRAMSAPQRQMPPDLAAGPKIEGRAD